MCPPLEPPLDGDLAAWLVLWEASLRDRGNDELAAAAGSYLLKIPKDRGINPYGVQRPDRLR
jgi:hypothetical protein